MNLNVGKELAALNRMSVDALRAKYAEVFGESTNGRHKQWLVKRIIWRMQSLVEGDLTERAHLRRRAGESVDQQAASDGVCWRQLERCGRWAVLWCPVHARLSG